jgi:hypothetical protein
MFELMYPTVFNQLVPVKKRPTQRVPTTGIFFGPNPSIFLKLWDLCKPNLFYILVLPFHCTGGDLRDMLGLNII